MDALELARWQFGATTVFHFLFVPLTIGLAPMIAIFQTIAYRTGDEKWLRLTKFFGKLFLINFALGVVTGIVQEFQFGMNWSSYSRYVGDIFGAPLAIEGLAAFFLESTFLGLWIFGWSRLPKGVHLATIWLVALGTWLSAYFILAANSWMQNPVGFRINEELGRAELDSFSAVLTNSNLFVQFQHTVLAALLTAAVFVLGVCGYHLLKGNDVEVFRPAAVIALVIMLASSLGTAWAGHSQAQLKTEQQPMKIAAAEALYETEAPASYSLFAVGPLDGSRTYINLTLPYLLSVLATNTIDGEVVGMNDLQERYEEEYGAGDYVPNVPVLYWTFRIMVGIGTLLIAVAALGLYLVRRKRLEHSRWFLKASVPLIVLPFVANSAGWIFTEMGRQPWVVQEVLLTADGVSPTVSAGNVLTSLLAFVAIYGVLIVVEVGLLLHYGRKGLTNERTAEDVGASLQY